MTLQADGRAVGGFTRRTGKHQPGCAKELIVLEEIRQHRRGQKQRFEQNLQVFGFRTVERIPTATRVLVVRRGQP
ncbi:hypothetical protein D9M71_717310 [compost metagenome]